VPGASTGHGTDQFCLSAVSESSKLSLIRSFPLTLFTPPAYLINEVCSVSRTANLRARLARCSAVPCFQTVAASDDSPPIAAINIGYVSPAVLPFSPTAAIRTCDAVCRLNLTFTGGRLAGITARLTVRPEEATSFDRKEKRKKTSSIWALSPEVEGDDMQKLIANLTENARLFAETRKLLGGGKVLEVVEDEQEQAPEVAAEFYPASVNNSSAAEGAVARSPSDTIPTVTMPQVTTKPLPTENRSALAGGNGSAKPPDNGSGSLPAPSNGNGSPARSGFNQLRNEFLTAARRVATTKKQAIGEVVEWASDGSFKYADTGRMTEGDVPKLQAATDLATSALAGAVR